MHDLAINNGTLLDPEEGLRQGALGIREGKIRELASHALRGKEEIDAAGCMVCPGFIDIHMHTEPPGAGNCFETLDHMALMGVTTAVGGNCGIGEGDVDPCAGAFRGLGAPVHFASFIGHAGLREMAGFHERYQPAPAETILRMSELLRSGLERGALGLSFGLEYIPGASFKEMLALSEVVAAFPGRLVAAHYRFDAERALEAIAEIIIIARETKVKFQISHIGSCSALGGRMPESLKMLETAHRAGVDVMADVYPYDAFCATVGSAVFDPGCFERWGVGYDAVMPVEGKYRGTRCTAETFGYIREQEPEIMVACFVMDEGDVIRAMQHPLVMLASDGRVRQGQGHPRGAGTFPRILGRYVREQKSLDLVTAVHKMTLMPARRLGLARKGRLLEGWDADLTLFDPKTVADTATFEEPVSPPRGIEKVLVEGTVVASRGKLTGKKPGVFLLWDGRCSGAIEK